MRKYAAALMLVVVVAGCSQLDFGLDSSEPEWGTAPSAGAPASSAVSQQSLDQVLAAWDAQAGPAEGDYLIGPGDELQVGIFALEKPGETSYLNRTVSSAGGITLPWVQGVKVQGLTVPGTEHAIKAAYDGRFIKDPQVTVNVTEYASSTVVVTGAVNRPGIYPLKHNEANLLECLSLAGGPSHEAGHELTLVRQPHGTNSREATPDSIRIDLLDLLGGGKPLLNVPVTGGDVITIAPRTDRYVYVLGYVRRPGAFKLTNLQRWMPSRPWRWPAGWPTRRARRTPSCCGRAPRARRPYRSTWTRWPGARWNRFTWTPATRWWSGRASGAAWRRCWPPAWAPASRRPHLWCPDAAGN